MSVFIDNKGDEWHPYLDAFLLEDVRKQTGVDLADISAGGWQTIATDTGACVRVLSVVCAEEIKARGKSSRQFARAMRGDAAVGGRTALLSEGADFFPPSEWSAIQSNLTKRNQMLGQTTAAKMMTESPQMLKMLEAFLRLPPDLQTKLIAAKGDTSSLISEEDESASGPVVTPSDVATDSPGKSEYQPAA